MSRTNLKDSGPKPLARGVDSPPSQHCREIAPRSSRRNRKLNAIDFRPLTRPFFAGNTTSTARNLIGKILIAQLGKTLVGGMIVEAEAYLPQGDSACHASSRQTRKNEAMFGPPGTAYVYSIHAKYCFNVVTEAEGIGAAVLIRAIEPWFGLSIMRRRRGVESDWQLASGPSKLCAALGISPAHNKWDLTLGRKIWLSEISGPYDQFLANENSDILPEIRATPRIGVTSAKQLPLRFVWAGHSFASGPKSWR